MEMFLEKEDENSDDVETAPKRKKAKQQLKMYKWKKTFDQISELFANLQPESPVESYPFL